MRLLAFIANPRASRRLLTDAARTCALRMAPSLLLLIRKLALAAGATGLGLRVLMAEHRLSGGARLTAEVRRRLPQIFDHLDTLIAPADIAHLPRILHHRAIVLQAPTVSGGRIRRGVLLIKFTESFRFFYHHVDVEKLLRYFRVVLEPSWSGYCLPDILFWCRYGKPVVVQASEPLDRRFLEELDTSLVPICVGASDWVDHRVFQPLGLQRDFDVIYVANLSPIKRVHVYLKTLGEIVARRGSVRAALVMGGWGGDKSTFDELLNLYSLHDQVEVFMNLKQPQLNELLNRARVSVLLSKKEGSNKTLFESMFADTPVLLVKDNIGVNKDYINEHTGMLVAEDEFAAAIERFMDAPPPLSPRTWAMANIAPEITARKLQALLDELYPEDATTTAALWPKVNTPEATYMDPAIAAQLPDIADTMSCFLRRDASDASEESTALHMQNLFGQVPAGRAGAGRVLAD